MGIHPYLMAKTWKDGSFSSIPKPPRILTPVKTAPSRKARSFAQANPQAFSIPKNHSQIISVLFCSGLNPSYFGPEFETVDHDLKDSSFSNSSEF